ncbi:lysoplasmalogenase [Lysobacter hankyongensis]|uniref:Lysoplasmalogenase n=1 Tax=Lysobacter hankyongensis TaxID=1176535 RepID=A0ABP9BVT4_9GAMM
MSQRALTLSILSFAALAIVGAWLGGPWLWLHYVGKPLTTLSILWLAASSSASSPRYRRAVLIGMALSLVGDVLLMLPGDYFVPGLIAFLLAHIGYVVAFAPGSSMKAKLGAFALLATVAGANLAGLLPRIGADLKIPVLAYVVVLASMAALALARAWTPALADAAPRSVRYAAAGGLCFVLSDSLLAWDKFGGGIPLPALLILASYWLAQWCIAKSVAER